MPAPQYPAAITAWLYPTLAFIGFLLAWELVVVLTQVKGFVLPEPLQVIVRGFVSLDLLLANTPATVIAIALGFAGAVIVGIPLAILMVASRPLESSLYPLLVGSQGVPKVALAPVLVVWFGFGVLPKVIMAMLIAFFPIVINTAVGLRSIDPNYLHLTRSMGAPAWRTYTRLLLPSALPQIFAGLQSCDGACYRRRHCRRDGRSKFRARLLARGRQRQLGHGVGVCDPGLARARQPSAGRHDRCRRASCHSVEPQRAHSPSRAGAGLI